MKYITGVFLLAVVGGLAGFAVWRLNESEPVRYRSAPVERDDLVVAVGASGTLEPVEIVDVGAQVAGRIKSLGADPEDRKKTILYGSKVKEGTVLAQIDEAPFQVALEQKQARVTMARTEQETARARFRQVERDWQRANNVKDTISSAEHDKFLGAYEIGKSELAVADARVRTAEADLKQAKLDLGYATITSPIDGVVIDRRANVGQMVAVSPDGPGLFLLAKAFDRLEIWASVNEADIGKIRANQPVEFTVDAYPSRKFSGAVTQIRHNASMTQNVVTYTVIVACDNPEGTLLPYMTANLKFEIARRSAVLLVPNRALRWRPELKQVEPQYREAFLQGAYPQVAPTPRTEPDGDGKPETGVLWLEASEGLLRPVRVRVGLTDGVRCHVTADGLREGTGVVIGKVSIQEEVGDFTSTFVHLPKDE